MKNNSAFDFGRWSHPDVAYSQCPFWFLNDELQETELVRQLDDFQAHGVEAFVIHPRIGLPLSMTWLGEEMLAVMRLILEEARKRGMWVVLYDEGMYPSGSSAGQVVAKDSSYRAHGLTCSPEGVEPPDDGLPRELIATLPRQNGERVCVYDQVVDSVIRGLHYLEDESGKAIGEEEFPAADLLNPAAMGCFIELVYDRYYQALGEYFGSTIKAIFTDEPHPLGRIRTEGARPGTTGILAHVNEFLGYDFAPHLPCLWFDDEPDAAKYCRDYTEAIANRLNETYYQPLFEWCERHGVALTGHPAEPDDFGHLAHFHWPGQDIVWRHVEPFRPSALEGAPSTMAKAAASSAVHWGRARNMNEFAGAFGRELTFFELRWLASWLLIRGCNLLMPHAFYYSIRGPRGGERPPEVGPHSPWWQDYRPWAMATRRLCWLNAELTPVTQVAIYGRKTELPWEAAKICFQNQVDFHYVDSTDLARAEVEPEGFRVGPAHYRLLLVEEGYQLQSPSEWPVWRGDIAELASVLAAKIPRVFDLDPPASDLRFRHLTHPSGYSVLLFFNEGPELLAGKLNIHLQGAVTVLDVYDGSARPGVAISELLLSSGEWAAYLVEPNGS